MLGLNALCIPYITLRIDENHPPKLKSGPIYAKSTPSRGGQHSRPSICHCHELDAVLVAETALEPKYGHVRSLW